MTTITNPSPLLANTNGTLTYIDDDLIFPSQNTSYILNNTSSQPISNSTMYGTDIINTFGPNVVDSEYSSGTQGYATDNIGNIYYTQFIYNSGSDGSNISLVKYNTSTTETTTIATQYINTSDPPVGKTTGWNGVVAFDGNQTIYAFLCTTYYAGLIGPNCFFYGYNVVTNTLETQQLFMATHLTNIVCYNNNVYASGYKQIMNITNPAMPISYLTLGSNGSEICIPNYTFSTSVVTSHMNYNIGFDYYGNMLVGASHTSTNINYTSFLLNYIFVFNYETTYQTFNSISKYVNMTLAMIQLPEVSGIYNDYVLVSSVTGNGINNTTFIQYAGLNSNPPSAFIANTIAVNNLFTELITDVPTDPTLIPISPPPTDYVTLYNYTYTNNLWFVTDAVTKPIVFDTNYNLNIGIIDPVTSVFRWVVIPTAFIFYGIFLFAGINTLSIYNQSANYNVIDGIVVDVSGVCFREGTNILCLIDKKEKYMAIEDIEPETFIKTYKKGYIKAKFIVKGNIMNTNKPTINKLYKMSKKRFPHLLDDLYITGSHAVLYDNISNENYENMEKLNEYYKCDMKIEDKYKLIAYYDTDNFEEYNEVGIFNIYHIVLENDDVYKNYGIYANGILVESTDEISLLRLKGHEIKGKNENSIKIPKNKFCIENKIMNNKKKIKTIDPTTTDDSFIKVLRSKNKILNNEILSYNKRLCNIIDKTLEIDKYNNDEVTDFTKTIKNERYNFNKTFRAKKA